MNISKKEIYDYLVELRDSGEINMWGAGAYLQDRFDMNRQEAKQALLDWMHDIQGEKRGT
jgi:hypothetical protein